MRTSQDLHLRFRLVGIGAGIGAFLLFVGLSQFPTVAELIYGNTLGPPIASLLSRITGIIPISLAEFLIVAFVIRQFSGAWKGLSQVRLRDRKLGNALAAGLLRLGCDLGIVVALFYLLWGFHYARQPLEERHGWEGNAAGPEELARLTSEMLEASNFAYATLHGSDDRGAPTELAHIAALAVEEFSLEDTVNEGWSRAEEFWGPPALPVVGYGRPKPLLSSRVLDYLGISGFYFPWTAEANFNRGTPALTLPHAVAHEMAHQRGFAGEDEANFAGYLVATLSPHAYVQYSAYVFAQRQLLAALARQDRQRSIDLVRKRFAGVQRDIEAADAYWAQFEGPAFDASRAINDAYLRANRVPGGVSSYNRSVELLIAYSRSRGGVLLR